MARTHFNGPVASANGFEGAMIGTDGSFSGNITVAGTATVTGATSLINLDLGASASAGSLDIFPTTALKGKLSISAADSAGNTTTAIVNASQTGARTYTIPDAGASASFVMTEGAQTVNGVKTFGSAIVAAVTGNVTGNVTGDLTGNVVGTSVTATTAKTDYQKFLGTKAVVLFGTGTWTITRLAQANYVARHTAAADTSILGIDITEAMRSAALKGFSLSSIDVIYSIGTLALNAHSATLDKISFVDAAAATITSVPITGTLTTATAADVKVVNMPVTTPAFNGTDDSKYVFELTVNAAATSDYDFYGIVIKFSRNDL